MFTPYAAAKYVNTQLTEAGLEKRIPPQMMYNYTSARVAAGKSPFIEWNEVDGVDHTSLEEWTKKYVAKQLTNNTVVADPEQAEFDKAEAN